MLSKQNSMINLSNYEEYFVLYVDNELTAEQRQMVENFIAVHPLLAEELEILMNTKLPVDDVTFSGKEELFSSAMKLNVVDESLLLYIDDELPPAEKVKLEEKLKKDAAYKLQYSILQQTKLDASENIPHPNKKELYRHTEKVVYFKTWMKIAVAVIILLFASLFFILTADKQPVTGEVVKRETKSPSQVPVVSGKKDINSPVNNEQAFVKAPDEKTRKQDIVIKRNTIGNRQDKLQKNTPDEQDVIEINREDVVRFDATKFVGETKVGEPIVNSSLTNSPVTSLINQRTTTEGGPEEFTDGDDEKKTPAKGLLRKVSRFLERRTGIATVTNDNELLVGAVALKLK